MAYNTRHMWMAPPQPEPNQPPKRDTSPMPLPTVGLGNNQVPLQNTISSAYLSYILSYENHDDFFSEV